MTIPKKPPAVELKTGERTWHIEGSRLESGWPGVWQFRRFRLARCTDVLFIFAPRLQTQVVGLLLLALAIGVLTAYVALIIASHMTIKALVAFGAFGCLFLIAFGTMGLVLITQAVQFDKAAGTITRRWLLKMGDVRSLQEVVAIQCLDAGPVAIGPPRHRSEGERQFQINLVLRLPPAFRVNVCTEPDERFVRDAARELAAFLGVPLVEQRTEEA